MSYEPKNAGRIDAPSSARAVQEALDARWSRQHFEMMADGGIWAVPRSGLVFTRRGDRLELTVRMPWTAELAEAASVGLDVPADEASLRAYQDEDFEGIRSRFEAAGVRVVDSTSSAGASGTEPQPLGGVMTEDLSESVPEGYAVCPSCDELVPVKEFDRHACPDDDTLAEIESLRPE